jgi:hypothetical protein
MKHFPYIHLVLSTIVPDYLKSFYPEQKTAPKNMLLNLFIPAGRRITADQPIGCDQQEKHGRNIYLTIAQIMFTCTVKNR